MTTGEWIAVAIFVGGLMCSLSLFWFLLRTVRKDRQKKQP